MIDIDVPKLIKASELLSNTRIVLSVKIICILFTFEYNKEVSVPVHLHYALLAGHFRLVDLERAIRYLLFNVLYFFESRKVLLVIIREYNVLNKLLSKGWY